MCVCLDYVIDGRTDGRLFLPTQNKMHLQFECYPNDDDWMYDHRWLQVESKKYKSRQTEKLKEKNKKPIGP